MQYSGSMQPFVRTSVEKLSRYTPSSRGSCQGCPVGVGGTSGCYTKHTLDQFQQLGLDHQRAIKLAQQEGFKKF
eukprot:918381-Pelagomonas_calceolata.AAC.1